MKKIEGNPSLYERIEEIKKEHVEMDDIFAATTATPLQPDLSLCNNSDNLCSGNVAVAATDRYKEFVLMPIVIPDAELISRDLEYLNGVTEPLVGWSLWKRIESGKEHRVAIDAAGVIRWERWYGNQKFPVPLPDPPAPVPDPVPKSEAHKWSVADCPACGCYIVWEKYPLGGGTRYFCGHGENSKKVELKNLTECPLVCTAMSAK